MFKKFQKYLPVLDNGLLGSLSLLNCLETSKNTQERTDFPKDGKKYFRMVREFYKKSRISLDESRIFININRVLRKAH